MAAPPTVAVLPYRVTAAGGTRHQRSALPASTAPATHTFLVTPARLDGAELGEVAADPAGVGRPDLVEPLAG